MNLITMFPPMVTMVLLSTLLTTAIIFMMDDPPYLNTYAQSEPSSSSPEDFAQKAQEFLSKLQEFRNQSNLNISSSLSSSNITYEDEPTQQFAVDVTGHYSNPEYGKLDFVIPDWWYGSERQWSGDKSISLDMHQGTEAEYLDSLSKSGGATSADEDVIVVLTLEAIDKKQLEMGQSPFSDLPSTSDTKTVASQCMTIEHNSTATINGKRFSISAVQCTYSSSGTQIGDPNDPELSFTLPASTAVECYEKIWIWICRQNILIQLTITKDSFPDDQNQLESVLDVSKYTSIIDTAAKTLKLQ